MEPAQIIVFVVVLLIAMISALSKKKKLPEFPKKDLDDASKINSYNSGSIETKKIEFNRDKNIESNTYSSLRTESNYNWNDNLALNKAVEDVNSNDITDSTKKDSDKTDLRKFIIMSEILKTKF